MSSPSDRPKFAVLGTGNAGQTFAADITLKGYSVNLAEVPEFESNLRIIEKKGGIEISGDAGNGFAELNMTTTDLKAAIKGVDIIIIGGSAHAHEPFSKALAHHFEDGQFIVFTSNFGALRFRKWMKEAGVNTRVTPVETTSLLYATRAVEPGVVACIGVKSKLPAAALPTPLPTRHPHPDETRSLPRATSITVTQRRLESVSAEVTARNDSTRHEPMLVAGMSHGSRTPTIPADRAGDLNRPVPGAMRRGTRQALNDFW